jgi:hypothetical protein
MSNGSTALAGVFRAPRMPFDLKCLALSTAGFLVLFGLNLLLERILGEPNPVGQLVFLLGEQLGRIAFLGDGFTRAMEGIWGLQPYGLEWWEALLTGAVFFGTWGLFGGAVLRTAALRLARDEPLSLKDAILFGGRNLHTFLLAPVLVVAAAAVFALCNAIAGFLMSLPWLVGSLLTIVLFPLVLLSSLLLILTLLAGVLGLPLMWAGVAFEQNGALEALSRAFSYFFARPLQFFFGYLLIFVFMSVIVLVGSFFEDTTKRTIRAWSVSDHFANAVQWSVPDVDQQATALREKTERRVRGIGDLRNIGNVRWDYAVGFFVMWLLLSAFLLGFHGYALYAFLGGTASLYLLLRKEVDGTDEEEIYLPETEAAPTAPPPEPKWVGGEGKPEGEAPAAAAPPPS